MEARLFFISLWCGAYAFLLRHLFRRFTQFKNVWTAAVFNGFFWATVGFVLAMLRASYLAGTEYQIRYSFIFAGGGFVLGSFLGFWRGKDAVKRDKLLKDNLEWADTGFSAILLASIFMFFIVQAFKIPSGSMRMTFIEGDHLFVNKFIYGLPVPFTRKKLLKIKKVKPGEVVIFRFPSRDKNNAHYGKDFIKRVVATEGETVEIKNKVVYVNGVPVEEEYKQHVDNTIYRPSFRITPDQFQKKWESAGFSALGGNDVRDNFGPVTVPKGHVMVMGDNRDRSYDSRFWGPLPLEFIKGKAWLLYWPLKRFKRVHK